MSSLAASHATKAPSKLDARLHEARLSFLQTSANHLAFTAPTTSAFLNSQADRNVSQVGKTSKAGKQLTTQLRRTCRGCGNLLIPGITESTSNEERHIRGRKKQQAAKNNKNASPLKPHLKTQITECQRCHTEIRSAIQPSLRITRGRVKSQPGSTIPTPPISVVSKKAATSNTSAQFVESSAVKQKNSAKARAKVRKKGGLAAQLEKSKTGASSSSGLGFDLTDFMSNV